MAEKKEQVKPLAPTSHRIDINKHDDFPVEFTSRRRRKCIKCCGCSVAVSLILVVTVLILMLTVLHVKDPLLKLNAVNIDGVDSLSGDPSGRNLTLVADVSLKNPNAASFKFENTTTYVYYGDSLVGEGRTPAGRVGARRSIRVSVLVDVMVDKIVEVESFKSDLSKGVLGISTNTRMSGKVKITGVSKKSVVVEMNCTMNVNVNVNRQVIEDRKCRTSILI
ncbi:hypothetical protein ACS0TY_004208 [Phlomoides rotata]